MKKEKKAATPKKEKSTDKSVKLVKAGEKAKILLQAVKNMQANGKRSIMQTLIIGFLVPVVMMIALGIVCYNTAASGMISKYQESAESTVSAVILFLLLFPVNLWSWLEMVMWLIIMPNIIENRMPSPWRF